MRFIVVLLAFGLVRCAGDQRPDNILSEKEMVHLLLDLYVAEDKFGRLPIPYDSMVKLAPELRGAVLDRAGIADSVYRNSMNYYMARPEKLELIYTALVDSLNLREQSMSTPEQKDAIPQ